MNYKGNQFSTTRYDINLANGVALKYKSHNGNHVDAAAHGDFGVDVHGNEVFVQNVANVGEDNGIYMFNLDNPNELGQRILEGTFAGGHVSGRNLDRPGWCYVTKQQEGYSDVFALKLDATVANTVQYFSQNHLKRDFYGPADNPNNIYLETYGSPSPDGTKVIFNSHWGHVNKKDIDTFIAEVK